MLRRQKIGWAIIVIVGGGLLALNATGYKPFDPPDEGAAASGPANALSESDARILCRNAILATAKWGGAEPPPHVPNIATGDGFWFVWPRGSFHFRNGFGGLMPMSAACSGSLRHGDLRFLELNGEILHRTP